MSHGNSKKASGILMKILIGSMAAMVLATGIYYWKGLDKLQNPEPILGPYYEKL